MSYKALKNKANRFVGEIFAIILSYIAMLLIIYVIGSVLMWLAAGFIGMLRGY